MKIMFNQIEVRHHRHAQTVDDIIEALIDAPEGKELQVRAGMAAQSSVEACTRFRRRLGVNYYVRRQDDGGELGWSVWIRRRLDDEPMVSGPVIRYSDTWMSLDEAADHLGITKAWLADRHCKRGDIARYRFGQRVLVKRAEVEAVRERDYTRFPGGAIVNAHPSV